ncbi:pyridoxal-phosphate dependent enzyme, partial [Candidatus Poribacteria bacterium]|nr:pyridoxal-phosphate dependent enzyme [Candidatus Poribacteria bacterium]
LKVIQETGGTAESVTDDEVVEGIKLLAETEGVFAETAGGVTIAALQKLIKTGQMDPEKSTVAYVTGNGLKTQEVLYNKIKNIIPIESNLESFEQIVKPGK